MPLQTVGESTPQPYLGDKTAARAVLDAFKINPVRGTEAADSVRSRNVFHHGLENGARLRRRRMFVAGTPSYRLRADDLEQVEDAESNGLAICGGRRSQQRCVR